MYRNPPNTVDRRKYIPDCIDDLYIIVCRFPKCPRVLGVVSLILIDNLVGGLEHVLFFHGKNHPNWRSHIFQRGRSATHQILIGFNIINQLFLWENQLFLWPFSTGMQLGKVFIPMLGGSEWDGNGTALRFWGNGHQSIFIRIYVPIKPYEDEHIPSYTHNGPNI